MCSIYVPRLPCLTSLVAYCQPACAEWLHPSAPSPRWCNDIAYVEDHDGIATFSASEDGDFADRPTEQVSPHHRA